ncbi:MAG: serine O-acetyltransferase [Candidatus Hadarchaeia archaeon]
MFESVVEDIETAFERDPAARSFPEVILCYPGLHAIWMHRVSHYLWERGLHLFARIISHISRFITGIEIHPGAEIGKKFFIDHGSGVVIGETAEIGENVLMYQGSVLGGTRNEKRKRHPTIEDDVVIGAGAVLLGPITVGKGSKIGAQSVVLNSVPPNSTVVGVPGRPVQADKEAKTEDIDLRHADLPDPVISILKKLQQKQAELEDKIRELDEKDSDEKDEVPEYEIMNHI